MRNILILFIILLSVKTIDAQQVKFDSSALNQVVYDSTLDNDILLGIFDVEGLRSAKVFKKSFKQERKYTPDIDMFMPGDNSLNELDISIVMGSWCPDSQREVPRMIMILENLDYPMQKVKIIAVNRWKKVPDMDLTSYNIIYVPTFIFYKDGVEVGRIVEAPKHSLEIDIINILNNIKQ